MAIKSYANKAAYDAATKPTTESQVSLIETTNDVLIDGVNVVTDVPQVADAVFLDESNNPVILKGGDSLVKAHIPSAWTYVGEVLEVVDGNHVRIIHNNISQNKKYADVLQYALTAISSTSLVLKLRMQDTSKTGDAQYATDIEVSVTLTSTAFDATTVSEITAALEAKATQLGDTADWWCYLADADNNKVDSDAARIVVQCDTWKNYQQYNCGATGGTISFVTWGEMPASNVYGFRVNDIASDQKVMNVARGAAYYGTNGSTPSSNVPLNATGTVVKKADFDSSSYCSLLRETYGTYENYIEKEYLVKFPQKLGVFSLPDGKAYTDGYGYLTAPTKGGSTKVKFPVLNWPLTVGFNADGLRIGDWHLWDVREGTLMMRDVTLAKINATRQKMGVTQISNGSTRWFAERSNVSTSWLFYGSSGSLSYYYGVSHSSQVGAITLLKYK